MEGGAVAGGGVLSPGDWICGDSGCGNVNFSRRSACNRCGRKRGVSATGSGSGAGSTEIGKSAADKSRGLFSADDWQCSKCANVNWARRLTCNVCNAPKFQEVEARTGYGGGYDERGVVEYRQRRDSDDDIYDEFGRVKKRKAKGKDPPSQSKVCGERRRRPAPGDGGATPASSAEKRKRASEGVDDAAEPPAARTRRARVDGPLRPDRPFVGRPRSGDCIMENRVTSTNDVKYTFRGKTADENFQVTYTLQERIKAAAWAIAFQNCKKSADRFQNEFDKPAPDFKTIFAWRQRLLDSGCLVDGHRSIDDRRSVDDRPTETRESAPRRRKRRRYFKAASCDSSDDSDCGGLPYVRWPRGDSLGGRRRLGSGVESADPNDKAPSINGTNTNGSICRSSTSGAKRSALDGSKRSDCCMTDAARSETPEITAARAELALLKSPVRVASPETQFRGDNYFDEITKGPEAPSSFLIPEIPKQFKEKSQKTPEDISKSMLEDIVSESERYSSEGDPIGSDPNDGDYEMYKNGSQNKARCSLGSKVDDKNRSADLPDFPEVNFRRRTISNNDADGSGKNFSSAMRRIIENMTNKSEEKDAENIEYVPTKIDPAMAIKNHRLFESIHDIWPEANSCSIDLPVPKRSEMMKSKIDKNLENYTPDDDTLYRNESSERKSDEEMLRTPPRAPDIGSLCSKNEARTIDVENINKLLLFNLSSINTDDIALALKNIQSLSSSNPPNGEAQKDDENIVQRASPIKKNNNIPFLDDMFYPGSPSSRNSKENTDVQTLDELGEPKDPKKCSLTVSGFKSFAIPKPILLNRLRNLNRAENGENTVQNVEDAKCANLSKIEKLKKKNNSDNGLTNKDDSKRLYDEENEVDEDSDEGDLSKYDLWGSDEEDKNKEKESQGNVSSEKDPKDNKKIDKANSPSETSNNRRNSERSRSASSRRSSSSSSSTTSSGSRPPRNRYDDFILNSEHSRGGSRDDSSSARSRSPFSNRGREKDAKKSHSRDRTKDKSRDNRDRDRNKKFRDGRDPNKSRDKGRDRDRDRPRHHKGHTNHGGYSRGRAR